MSPPVSKYTSIYYVFVLGEGGGGGRETMNVKVK